MVCWLICFLKLASSLDPLSQDTPTLCEFASINHRLWDLINTYILVLPAGFATVNWAICSWHLQDRAKKTCFLHNMSPFLLYSTDHTKVNSPVWDGIPVLWEKKFIPQDRFSVPRDEFLAALLLLREPLAKHSDNYEKTFLQNMWGAITVCH